MSRALALAAQPDEVATPSTGRTAACATPAATPGRGAGTRPPPVPIEAIGLANPTVLDEIALLRAKHFAKGHTPESDSRHGASFFWHGAHEFLWQAMDAPDRQTRRKHQIAAAAMLVAMIDAEDYLAERKQADA